MAEAVVEGPRLEDGREEDCPREEKRPKDERGPRVEAKEGDEI